MPNNRPHHTSHVISQGLNASPNIVGVHYRVGKKIGQGSFGVIYEGVNLLNQQKIAIKFESKKSEAPQLKDEYRTYKLLQGIDGIPGIYYFGSEGQHNILCLDLLGPSLEDCFDLCQRKFSIKTVCTLARHMITLVQNVHEKNLIYRDIKPDNFLISHPNSKRPNQVFMVDFGMAKFYRDPKTKQHIPYREKKSLSGTARYMSINTHLGREQSRRDDLEALGHVFMYFIRGSLPWQGLKAATNKQKYEKIGEKKQTTPINELCQGHPKEFGVYLKKVRGLAFEETPDYDGYRQLFTQVLIDLNVPDDGVYDWMVGNSPSPPNHKINALPPKHPINTEPLTPGGRSNEANSQLISMLPHLGNSTHHLRPSLQAPRTPEYPQQTHTNNTSTTLQPVPPMMTTDTNIRHSMGKPSSPHRLSEHHRDYSPHAMRNQNGRNDDRGQAESSVQKMVSFFTCRTCS